MIIKGEYNEAKVFATELDKQTKDQIQKLCDQEFFKDAKIRVMPDAHAGMGSTIGTTMTLGDKVVPNLVGVDIGCGMYTVEMEKDEVDFKKLDHHIRKHIPHGFNNHKKPITKEWDMLMDLKSMAHIGKDASSFAKALGSLGSGNHFIELGKGEGEKLYLVIHSGSRNLGYQVARYYQKLAENNHKGNPHIPKELSYLEGEEKKAYLHDMVLVQRYAKINREMMAKLIVQDFFKISLQKDSGFHTVHNYIDLNRGILRKGAISAEKEEKLLIPMNMRDGCILGEGLGNEEWNYSAPHGAGRIMSRKEAFQKNSMKDFHKVMENVFSTSISKKTLDEAPMSYKPMKEIIKHIHSTLTIKEIITPIYNFKAS